MKKFKLTSESIIKPSGRTLYRIKGCTTFTTFSGDEIKVGDLGGFVEKESNLSHDGKAWISDNAEVYDNAKVYDNARVHDTEVKNYENLLWKIFMGFWARVSRWH